MCLCAGNQLRHARERKRETCANHPRATEAAKEVDGGTPAFMRELAPNVGSGGMGYNGDRHSGEIPAFCKITMPFHAWLLV